jgi:hypothetical protein
MTTLGGLILKAPVSSIIHRYISTHLDGGIWANFTWHLYLGMKQNTIRWTWQKKPWVLTSADFKTYCYYLPWFHSPLWYIIRYLWSNHRSDALLNSQTCWLLLVLPRWRFELNHFTHSVLMCQSQCQCLCCSQYMAFKLVSPVGVVGPGVKRKVIFHKWKCSSEVLSQCKGKIANMSCHHILKAIL